MERRTEDIFKVIKHAEISTPGVSLHFVNEHNLLLPKIAQCFSEAALFT